MKKLIVCLLGTLILSAPIHAHNLADVIEDVLPSITYIEIERHEVKQIIDTSNRTITEIRQRATPSVGTGFVIDNNRIVTNFHVISRAIEDQERIFVKFHHNNGIQYEANIVGYDEVADIALLEIRGTHPSLEIADDSASMRMGEDVFSISNFYSIRHSATQGIISSNDRIDRRYPYIRLFQLQILEGSGSSGGPVLNEEGEVVAVNQSILSMIPDSMYRTPRPSIMSMIAFTVRGDQLLDSIERIEQDGVVVREDLGLYLQSYGMTSERYLYNPVPNAQSITGVLVTRLDVNADEQFKIDDIITSVNGVRFTSSAELLVWLDENTSVGDEVKIQVYRDQNLLNITTEVKAARRFR